MKQASKRSFKSLSTLLLAAMLGTSSAPAALIIGTETPHLAGQKVAMRLQLENTFQQKIESVRGSLFLFNSQGKIVSQASRWIVGGGKNKPMLAPGAKATYDFVVAFDKPFSQTKLMVNRVILEGGKLADVSKDVTVKTKE